MKKILLPILAIAFHGNVFSQFIKEYYSPTGQDLTFNAIMPYEQNLIVAGNDGKNILFCEIDNNGELINSSTIVVGDGTVLPVIMSILVDSDDKIVAVGYMENTATTATGFVLKYDFETSTVLWLINYENEGSYLHQIIEPIPGDDYVIAGQDFISGNGQEGLLFSSNRTTGEINTIYNINQGSNSETFYSVAYKDGIYYLSSRLTINESTSKMRACKVEITEDGELISNETYLSDPVSETARLYAFNIEITGSNIFMTIYGDNTGTASNKDLFLMKSEVGGDINWIKQYNLTNYTEDGSWNSIKSNDGNAYLFGSLKDGSLDGKGSVFIIKIDDNGEAIWSNSYDLETNYAYNHPDAMMVDATNIFVVGSSFDDGEGIYNGRIMVLSKSTGELPTGCSSIEPVNVTENSTTIYNFTSTDVVNSIASIELTTSTDGSPEYDASFACGTVGINTSTSNTNFKLFPNPANNLVNVDASFQFDLQTVVRITDAQGRILLSTNAKNAVGLNSLNIDLSKLNLLSGIYLISINHEDNVYNTPLIIE